MILRRYDFSLEDFQAWSKDYPRYLAESCAIQLKSFKYTKELQGKGYTVATLINIAKKFGYKFFKQSLHTTLTKIQPINTNNNNDTITKIYPQDINSHKYLIRAI